MVTCWGIYKYVNATSQKLQITNTQHQCMNHANNTGIVETKQKKVVLRCALSMSDVQGSLVEKSVSESINQVPYTRTSDVE